jgi:hypothetical protein
MSYFSSMKTLKQSSGTSGLSRIKGMRRRFEFAKASLAIEGMPLTHEETVVFRTMVRAGCDLEQMDAYIRAKLRQDAHAGPLRG